MDTRIGAGIGRRRDEIADLAHDFDFMAARLEALVTAQKKLLADVSHELRSPLARLRVAVELARQSPDKVAASLDRIELEGQRLDELVGELLTLSRMEAGVTASSDDYADLRGLLEEVVADAEFEAGPRGCRVVLIAAGDPLVRGRAELLRRAMENVIRNAILHTAPGSEVEVSLESHSAGEACIRVCDRGGGIPEGELAEVFEPFRRGGADRGVVGREGFGLGLAIARRAVEAHGGGIKAENRSGGGLCVEIRLPTAEQAGTPP